MLLKGNGFINEQGPITDLYKHDCLFWACLLACTPFLCLVANVSSVAGSV